MRAKPITLQDIAVATGFSRATVSRALNDHPDISDTTKQRIAEAARSMGYHTNLMARGLSQRESHIIGVIVPTIHRPFWAKVISGIEAVAYQAGYRVMICQSDEQYRREVETVGALVNSMVDGLIVASAKETRNVQHIQEVLQQGLPLLIIERGNTELPITQVVTDDFGGALMLVNYLAEAGYQRIAHLTGPSQLQICRERQRGYRTALLEHQLNSDPRWVIESEFTRESAGESFRELMTLPNPPDAVFCFADIIATGALLAAQEMQLSVPDTVAIAGFGDDDLSQFIGLTTVSQSSFAMGQRVAQLLLDEITQEEGSAPIHTEVFGGKLVIRTST
ncbi:MAG: LacI family DNA-binding transcriptional regulator [Tunicatimonas sp.]